jgi:hypothetical protein
LTLQSRLARARSRCRFPIGGGAIASALNFFQAQSNT